MIRLPLLLAAALIATSPGTTAAQSVTSNPSVAKARAELAAGRAREAVALVETTLASAPANVDAMTVKVEALIALDARTEALDAYDAWATAARQEQLSVLSRIARAELTALSKQGLSAIAAEALVALANTGEASARPALEKLAWATPPTGAAWPATVALARLGDAKARARLLQSAKDSTGSGRAEAIRAIGEAKIAGADTLLRESLATRDPMLQSAAAQAVATLELKALVPDVQKTAREGEQFAKFVAAVALADLGASGGESLIDAALTSPAADMRLEAARPGARAARRTGPRSCGRCSRAATASRGSKPPKCCSRPTASPRSRC